MQGKIGLGRCGMWERASEGERERERELGREGGEREREREEGERGGREGRREREGGRPGGVQVASILVSLRHGFDVDAMSVAGVDLTRFLKGWDRSRGFKRLG